METSMLESGITTAELTEWKRLSEAAPLNGISYVTMKGGVVDLSGPYPKGKASALADFLNAARNGWPRTVLALEEARRERDELRAQLDAARLCAGEIKYGLEFHANFPQHNDDKVTEFTKMASDEVYLRLSRALHAASEAGLLDSRSVESVPESVSVHDPSRLAPVMRRDEDDEDDWEIEHGL